MSNKGSKFSVRQLLNLIIISISAMFLLFVLVGKMMNRDASIDSAPVEVSLQRIDFEVLSLWKDDQKWNSTNVVLTPEEIDLLINRWQSLVNQSGKSFNGAAPQGKTVLLYFSNIPQPVICKISRSEEKLFFTFVASSQRFERPADELNLYYPEAK